MQSEYSTDLRVPLSFHSTSSHTIETTHRSRFLKWSTNDRKFTIKSKLHTKKGKSGQLNVLSSSSVISTIKFTRKYPTCPFFQKKAFSH